MRKEDFKIAFDHQIFQAQKYGGVSRYYANLAKNFISEKIDIKIFAPLHQNVHLKDISLNNNLYLNTILPKTDRIISLINQRIVNSKLKYWQPKLIHQTYYSNSKYDFDFNPTIITTIHDMIHEKYPLYFPANNRTIQNKKISINNAHHLICVSESTKNDLMNIYNISEDKISVVHHGFELNQDNIDYDDKIIFNKPYLLYVGNRDGYKNFHFFIKSISYSKKIMSDFDIIAFGGGKFDKTELIFFKDLGFKNDQLLQMSGNDSLLNYLYRNATAFIYPSLYEGFGLPPLEAMANNCPVVSSNTSSIPEVIGDAGMYFDPRISENIVDSIETVIYSESKREMLINSGKERLKFFSWKQCAINTAHVYKKAILNR
jgi:glycosyltransferase involved in cell wall biosynthesis